MEHETGTRLIDEALSLGHFHAYPNGLDSYGFHGLEALQCMVERRRGGETGIAAVRCIEGRAVWEAAERGLWPRDLAAAAESRIAEVEPGRMEDNCVRPALFELEYADGLRAFTLMLDRHVKGFAYAARVNGETISTGFHTLGSHGGEPFTAQGLAIQEMFLTGRPPVPRRAYPSHHRRPRRPNGLPPPRRHPHRDALARHPLHRLTNARSARPSRHAAPKRPQGTVSQVAQL